MRYVLECTCPVSRTRLLPPPRPSFCALPSFCVGSQQLPSYFGAAVFLVATYVVVPCLTVVGPRAHHQFEVPFFGRPRSVPPLTAQRPGPPCSTSAHASAQPLRPVRPPSRSPSPVGPLAILCALRLCLLSPAARRTTRGTYLSPSPRLSYVFRVHYHPPLDSPLSSIASCHA